MKKYLLGVILCFSLFSCTNKPITTTEASLESKAVGLSVKADSLINQIEVDSISLKEQMHKESEVKNKPKKIAIVPLVRAEVVEEKIPLMIVDTLATAPQFPGGSQELMKFIGQNMRYPLIAVENGIQGRVCVRFLVGKDGTISDVEILRGIDPSCDKEALRIVKLMPKWIPGEMNGKKAKVYHTLPVVFRLRDVVK